MLDRVRRVRRNFDQEINSKLITSMHKHVKILKLAEMQSLSCMS